MAHPTRTDRRAHIARSAADAVERAAPPAALVGFDGFIDVISRAVDRRRSMAREDYQPIPTIERFAARIGAAAGRSANIELVVGERRFGGNGALMAAALASLGVPTAFIGAVEDEGGRGGIHPLFAPLAGLCREVHAVAPPALTDAIEFDDGKIMLGRPDNVQKVTWERLEARVGLERIGRLVAGATLIGIVNWTLAGGVEGIWRGLIERILPGAPPPPAGRRRVFIDLSDPAKRTDQDLARALGILREMSAIVPVTLGLNLAEAERIALIAGSAPARIGALEACAAEMRLALGLECIVIHRRQGAAAASAAESSSFEGPFTATPRLSTGAGDHFNAGFALGRMLDLAIEHCLAVGCAVGGAFVRDGSAPDRARLASFLRDLPLPERGRRLD